MNFLLTIQNRQNREILAKELSIEDLLFTRSILAAAKKIHQRSAVLQVLV